MNFLNWTKFYIPPPVPPPQRPTISPPAPIRTTAIGSAVLALDGSYQTLLAKRAGLDTQIADLREERRQSIVMIAALEAAMTVVCADPALTEAEKQVATAAVSNRIEASVGEVSDV
jgi:hypothetical protein